MGENALYGDDSSAQSRQGGTGFPMTRPPVSRKKICVSLEKTCGIGDGDRSRPADGSGPTQTRRCKAPQRSRSG